MSTKTTTPTPIELSWSDLYIKHYKMVRGICYNIMQDTSAEDACMDVFEKVRLCPPKETVDNWAKWLSVVAKNHCYNILRRNAKMAEYEAAAVQQNHSRVAEPKAIYWNQQQERQVLQKTMLDDSLRQLKEKQRECLELFYLQQYSYVEICEITGFSLNEVKSHLQCGRRNMRKMLSPMKELIWR